MSTNDIDIWKLFRQEFKDGEQVIIVHEDCKLYGGKLTAYETHCTIGSRNYKWGEIVFIAHDGFPCRALRTTLSDEQLGDIENEDAVILLRKTLLKPPEKVIVKEVVTETVVRRPRLHSYAGGCPFLFDEIQIQLLNPFSRNKGNFEETLFMKSKDGAFGMFWGIEDELIEFYPGVA